MTESKTTDGHVPENLRPVVRAIEHHDLAGMERVVHLSRTNPFGKGLTDARGPDLRKTTNLGPDSWVFEMNQFTD